MAIAPLGLIPEFTDAAFDLMESAPFTARDTAATEQLRRRPATTPATVPAPRNAPAATTTTGPMIVATHRCHKSQATPAGPAFQTTRCNRATAALTFW